MIGELVVNIGAEVRDFESGAIKVRTGLDTVSTKAAKTQFSLEGISRSMAGIQTASNGLAIVSQRFNQLGSSSKLAETGVFKVSSATESLTTKIKGFETGTLKVQSGLDAVSDKAANTQFTLQSVARSMVGIKTAANGLSVVSQRFRIVGSVAGLAATGVAQVATAAGMLSNAMVYASAGVGVLLKPLAGLVIVPKVIAASFGLMFAAILAPFKALIAVVSAVAKGVWALASPFIALAKAVFNLKVFFSSLSIQLAVLRAALSIMPPKVRILVGGLIALGAASKALGVFGRVGAVALRAMGAAANVAKIGIAIATLNIRKLGKALLATSLNAASFALAIGRVTKKLVVMSITKTMTGVRKLGGEFLGAAGSIAGKFTSAVTGGLKALVAITAVGIGWGAKLAIDAELAQTSFATMLKSGAAAKNVLADLEQFAASTPFQLNDLRDGAKQLLNAQVPTQNLTNRLRMLGDVASGTGKPINDFVRIFAKVKSTGKVSLETLNQLAERGVPIYSALQKQLGKSRTEMLSMISKGKVGFNDLDGALKATATGTGVFAGGMKNASQTTGGLISTLKDNVGFAFRDLANQIMKAFDFKGMINQSITFFQSMKAGIANATPLFSAIAATVKTAFTSIWEIATVTMSSIGALFGLTSGNLMTSLMTALGVAKYVFAEWPTIAELAFKQMALSAVAGFNTITHFFTGVLPALFNWFGQNWFNIFRDAFNLSNTIFDNLATNVAKIFTNITDIIRGKLSVADLWTPLTDGFKSSISELPNIPDRAIGQLEQKLQQDVSGLANRVGEGVAKEIAANLDMLTKFRNEQAKKNKDDEVDPGTQPDAQAFANDVADDTATGGSASSQSRDSQAGSLDRGSEAALSAVLSQANNSRADKQLTLQQQTIKAVEKSATTIASAVSAGIGGGFTIQPGI